MDFNSSLPFVKLAITVAGENLDNLDEIIETASRHGIDHIELNLMSPQDEIMFHKSIFVNFDESKKRINSIISRWNKEGVLVTVIANTKKLQNSFKVCPL